MILDWMGNWKEEKDVVKEETDGDGHVDALP